MRTMPKRQIHLDFHTSPLIEGIGAEFSADEFGATLKKAHVEHINLFAKCHHGWFYYPSAVGKMHPGLSFDLLGAQTEACRRYGISYSIYTCVGWNERTADEHPDWLELPPDGPAGYKAPGSREFYEWQTLCLNQPDYRELICAELREEYERFSPLGFWIDIIQPHECACPCCRKKAFALGLDIEKQEDRVRLARLSQLDYMRDIHSFVMALDPKLHLYFNGHAYACDLGDEPALSNSNKRKYVTFLDIESLPSPEWGYAHFPVSVNYVNKYDTHDVIMMNGKFHLAWGDFGTLRNREALEYECFRAVANGAGVCVGDQLHPAGRLEKSVYERIGAVFEALERTEQWCTGSRKMAQIAVYTPTKSAEMSGNSMNLSLEGAYRVLTEQKYQYDIVDLTDDISGYALLILPDEVTLTAEAARRIDEYVEKGGRLLTTGFSGRELCCMPVVFEGSGNTCPRYMDIPAGVFPCVPAMKTVAYSGGAKIAAKPGAQVLCETVDSYFDRTDEHFCSHRQTPPKPHGDGEPCIVTDGQVSVVSNVLFRDLAQYGVRVYKDILSDLIGRLVETPWVLSDLPAYAEVTLRRLGRSIIVHVLNYLVQRKCRELDTVEEVVPLFDRTLRVYTGCAPEAVYLQPEGKAAQYSFEDGYTVISLERLDGRCMIEIRLS